MRKARKGTNVIYIPGNHDEAARQYCQLTFGERAGRRKRRSTTTPDGRKLLVIHGDQFDGIVRYARWLAILGDWAYSRGAAHQHRLQLGAPQARPALLVAVGLPQAQGQERGAVHRQLRARGRRARRAGAASTAWSAATSITPRSATSTASSTATTATGSRAAPRWSRTSTAACASSTGPRKHARRARDAAAPRAGAAGGGVDRIAHRHRLRRLATADQRRGAHHRDRGPAAAGRGPRRRGVRPRPLPHPALPDLSRDPPVAVPGGAAATTC